MSYEEINEKITSCLENLQKQIRAGCSAKEANKMADKLLELVHKLEHVHSLVSDEKK